MGDDTEQPRSGSSGSGHPEGAPVETSAESPCGGPCFSVVVPVKNDPLVDEAIDSILGQSDPCFEVIVVDDGSEPPLRLATSDERVRVVRSEVSAGPAGARNVGLRSARGRYLAFLDSDDRYEPHRLEDARRAHGLASVVVAWPTPDGAPAPVADPGRLLDGTVPHLGQTTIERSVGLDFDSSYPACEDVDWWIRTLDSGVTVALSGREGWTWRRGDHPRPTHGAAARLLMSRRLLRDHSRFYGRHRRARAFRWRRIAAFERSHGSLRRSAGAACRSLVVRPSGGGVIELVRTMRSAISGSSRDAEQAAVEGRAEQVVDG